MEESQNSSRTNFKEITTQTFLFYDIISVQFNFLKLSRQHPIDSLFLHTLVLASLMLLSSEH